MPPRIAVLVRIIAVIASSALAACTLTSEPFEPNEAVRPLNPTPDNASTDPNEDDGASVPSPSGEACTSEAPLTTCNVGLTQPDGSCARDAECESRRCEQGRCQPATCADGVANQGESALDCGGPCPARCIAGDACKGNSDCAEGLFCPTATGQCAANSCRDSVQNGDEISMDCGGGCPGCPAGTPCSAAADCESGICDGDGTCTAPTCTDTVKNQSETATDCGGTCPGCASGQACASASDCQSGVCAGEGCAAGDERCCQAPTCEDGVQNGGEPQVDCGNTGCGLCANGNPCTLDAQCASGFCVAGACGLGPCADGRLDGSETDVDCGGFDPACRRCAAGDDCTRNQDCASDSCVLGRCSSCGDGLLNGTETGIDCGGGCAPCEPGLGCATDADCQSNACQDGLCCGGVLVDCTRCARRLSGNLNCNSNGPAAAPNCEAFLDCLAANPDICPIRYSPGCSDDPGGVCNHTRFGGNTGAGVALADAILGTSSCFF